MINGNLAVSFTNALGPYVCRYADSTTPQWDAIDISREECTLWQQTLTAALAAGKPVSLTFMVPQFESCDTLLMAGTHHWRVTGVAVLSQ